MQYAIYTNEKLRRVMVSLLCFLVIFLMVNIIVQSIYVQRVDASAVALAPFLIEYAVPFLAALLGVGGIVYADMSDPSWTIQNPVDAFVSFVEQFYDDYMKQDIITFLESFQSNGYTTYADIPQNIRQCFLDFAQYQSDALSMGGELGYEAGYTGNIVATPETGAITVENIPSLTGLGFTYEITRMEGNNLCVGHAMSGMEDTDGSVSNYFDRWAIYYYGPDVTFNPNEIDVHHYSRSTGAFGVYHAFRGPYEIYNNEETGEFQHLVIQVGDHMITVYSRTNEGLHYLTDIVPNRANEDRWTRFTGHTDVSMTVSNATVQITSATAGTITGDDVIDDGTEWREEHEDDLREEVVPPWTDVGTGTITIPVGGIDDLTGEGTDVGDVTAPIDVPVDYPSDWPIDAPTVSDLPVDIPAESSGSWINKLLIPFEGMQDKFPFSLPWDVMRILALFDHYEAQAPSFEISYDMFLPSKHQGTGKVFMFDFGVMQDYVGIVRFFELIIADLILIMWILRHYVSG